MAHKRYSKKKLAFFKKHIQTKLDALTNDLDDSKGNLDSNTGGSSSLLKNPYIACTWLMQVQIHMKERKAIIF